MPENLGEALAGEKAHTSAYKARVRVNEYCKVLCRKTYTPKQMEEFQDFAILEVIHVRTFYSHSSSCSVPCEHAIGQPPCG